MHHTVLSIALASADSPSQPEWWQTVNGIIGIGIAIFTLGGALFAIPKLRLESKKLKLEIREKERALADARAADDPIKAAEIVAEPTFQVRTAQDIILRAILLVMILYIWNFIQVIFSDQLGVGILDLSFRDILIVLYWVILAAMGWPVLLDILQALSIGIPRFLQGRIFRWLIVLLTAFLIIVHLEHQLLIAD
jgi:hypothetical protein